MAFSEDVGYTVKKLLELGILTEEGCTQFANAVRPLEALGEQLSGTENLTPPRRRGRPPKDAGSPATKAKRGRGKRRTRGKFSISKEEFAKLYQHKTAKEIAAQFGVAPGTVAVRASKLGLKKSKGRPAKKVAKATGKK